MPLYEYECRSCGRRFTFLTGVIADNSEPACPQCHSTELQKLISRVARGRSDDDRMDAIAEKLETSDLDDPRGARKFAREMGREMSADTGEDFSDEMEAMIDAEAEGGMEGEGDGGSHGGGDDTIY